MIFKRKIALALITSLSLSCGLYGKVFAEDNSNSLPVSPIPKGYQTLTATLVFKDAKKAIEFYKKAFNAKEKELIEHENKVIHAELKIGDSPLMLSDEFPEGDCLAPKEGLGYMSIYMYVNDVDKAYKQAINSGAKSKMEPCNMFWGDRYASVQDPFGYIWQIATHKEDLSLQEVKRRSKEFFSTAKDSNEEKKSR